MPQLLKRICSATLKAKREKARRYMQAYRYRKKHWIPSKTYHNAPQADKT